MLIFNGLEDIGLLLLRLALAAIFIYHGFPKIKNPSIAAGMIGINASIAFLMGLGEVLAEYYL